MKNKALVVIDLQNDITKNYREIIETTNQAIDWAAANNMDVVYIQHNNLSAGTRTFKPGTRGADFVPELKIVSDHIFTKTKSNALTSDEFAAFIQAHDITGFYIAGADATACIKSTCYNMRKAGFPFIFCLTASPVMTKRSCLRCLNIMQTRAAPSGNSVKSCKSFRQTADCRHEYNGLTSSNKQGDT